MELFERIEKLALVLAGNKTKLAKILGIPQGTFTPYFSLESQEKFLRLLPKILDNFPEVSRDWLYFGEGEMVSIEKKIDQDKKSGDTDWKEKYYSESESHKKTLMELVEVRQKLILLREETSTAEIHPQGLLEKELLREIRDMAQENRALAKENRTLAAENRGLTKENTELKNGTLSTLAVLDAPGGELGRD